MSAGDSTTTVSGDGVEQLYHQHYRPLLAYLTRMVSDREAAEDLCQESFIKALRNWHTRQPGTSELAWLYRIATNTAYDFLRRRQRIRFMPFEDSDQDTMADESNLEARLNDREPIRAALAQIPELYRVPLLLYSVEGRSTQDIATKLGCSNSAVKTRLFRARERFRQVYSEA